MIYVTSVSGVNPFQHILELMTWYMQQDFYLLKLVSSTGAPHLICSLRLIDYFDQRYQIIKFFLYVAYIVLPCIDHLILEINF